MSRASAARRDVDASVIPAALHAAPARAAARAEMTSLFMVGTFLATDCLMLRCRVRLGDA
jgi:hypothetical protein